MKTSELETEEGTRGLTLAEKETEEGTRGLTLASARKHIGMTNESETGQLMLALTKESARIITAVVTSQGG